jgi:glyoxylase-like metal-dependent hydrolase (beta-lactamase superfamily II)
MESLKICFVSFILIVVAGSALPGTAGEYSLDVKRISERAIVITVEGDENVVALNSGKGVIVIDTTISPVFAALVREKIEEEFSSKNFAYVINTHFHGDHTYGNQVFSEAVFIGHENCPEGMRNDEERRTSSRARYKAGIEQMKKGLEKMDETSDQAKSLAKRIAFYQAIVDGTGEDFVLTPPGVTFNDRLSLDLGDMSLNLYSYGTSHTDSDILIHCPEEGLWMTGDLFAAGYDPYIDSERVPFIPRWIANIEMILKTEVETRHISAGHGNFISFDELKRILNYFEGEKAKFEGKESAFTIFKADFAENGLESGLETLVKMSGQTEIYFTLHPEIDQYAYRMMLDGKVDEALDIFKVLAELFPDSDIAFDSLGEVYMRKENTEMAITSFKKSLELNPENRNAQAKLKALQIKK